MTSPVEFNPANTFHSQPATPFHVLAKPTGPKCNLQCEYCFYKEKEDNVYLEERKANSLNMDELLLEQYVPEYIRSQQHAPGREINFLWQGGEPTMRGLAYFEKAVALQKQYCPEDKVIHNHFQTNGILINEAWAQFFAEHGFLIGLSIDGPKAIHDKYRKTLKGGGSFDKVMKGLSWLKKYAVPFNTMTVIGRHNQNAGADVYRALRDMGSVNMQFIPLVERFDPQQHLSSPPEQGEQKYHKVTKWSVTEGGYGRFMNDAFDEWIKADVGKVSVQLFDVQLEIWLGKPSSLCIYTKNCGGGVVMEHNGDVYSCDHYVYPEYKLGNAYETTLESMALSAEQQAFGAAKYETLPDKCLNCDYQKACYGGCPKHRFNETRDGTYGLNYLCKSYMAFFEHAGPWIHQMAQLIRHGRSAADIMQHPQIRARREGMQVVDPGSVSRNGPCVCGSGKKFKRCCGSA
ncbi:anaerobic sulfatase maturase [Aliamphritea hakodatensis]|uniref:anaerobic sulfatase maturase n=1 Tax=Aliamphritea hakodatensis TaxID=2895352 RepID=UPI0022FD3D05|nr:anaerobic sulfatase maturase [Aliamphritea hakodatensis]